MTSESYDKRLSPPVSGASREQLVRLKSVLGRRPDGSAGSSGFVLTRKLHDLLYREAHLKLWRTQLVPRWSGKEAELRAVQASRPMLLAIMPRRRRDAYQTRLTAAEETVKGLRERVDLLDRCEPALAKMIEHEIEQLLREDCPQYLQALAAHRQKEDWLRCLEHFAEKNYEFTRALGNVRNLACSGYARHSGVYSQGAMQAFGLAVQAARLVEDQVRFANRIADAQIELLRSNGVETRPLPRLPDTGFSDWVTKISQMPLTEAQVQFDSLIGTTKRLHETGVPELRAQADQVQQTQEADIRNFLSAAWEQFRAEVAPEIFSGDTERTVTETERMLESIARAGVVGRL